MFVEKRRTEVPSQRKKNTVKTGDYFVRCPLLTAFKTKPFFGGGYYGKHQQSGKNLFL